MRGKMQYAILHNSSKRLIATLELPKFFGIPILTFLVYFMTCISSQTVWQTASRTGTWPPSE